MGESQIGRIIIEVMVAVVVCLGFNVLATVQAFYFAKLITTFTAVVTVVTVTDYCCCCIMKVISNDLMVQIASICFKVVS